MLPIEDDGGGACSWKLLHGDVSHGGRLGSLVAMVVPPVFALAPVLAARVIAAVVALAAAVVTTTLVPLGRAVIGTRLTLCGRVVTMRLRRWRTREGARRCVCGAAAKEQHAQEREPTDASADEQILLLLGGQRHVRPPS
jgi:hypothetical protein